MELKSKQLPKILADKKIIQEKGIKRATEENGIKFIFSIDSILTAIGLTNNVPVMIIAVVLSVIIMMLFSGPVGDFVKRHPSVQMR